MKKEIGKDFIGRWRITEMEQWDQDFIDLVVEGYCQFDKDGTGDFKFGAVQGSMDWQVEKEGKKERAIFTWEGSDEMDPISGRGWVEVNGDALQGRIYFHLGENSRFTAKRKR